MEWFWPLTRDMWGSVRLMPGIICNNAPLMPAAPPHHHYEESSNLDQIKSKRRTAGQGETTGAPEEISSRRIIPGYGYMCHSTVTPSACVWRWRWMRNRLLDAPTEPSKSHVEVVRHTRPPPLSFHMLLVFDEKSHIKSKTYSSLGNMWTGVIAICVHSRDNYLNLICDVKLIWHAHFLTVFLFCSTSKILHAKSHF